MEIRIVRCDRCETAQQVGERLLAGERPIQRVVLAGLWIRELCSDCLTKEQRALARSVFTRDLALKAENAYPYEPEADGERGPGEPGAGDPEATPASGAEGGA